MSDYKGPETEKQNHPLMPPGGAPDTPIDWDAEPWYRIMAENYAERNKTSLGEATRAIRAGCDDMSYWNPSRPDAYGHEESA